MGSGIVAGKDGSNGPQPIHATQDGAGNWRLMVEALISGITETEVDLDHETDSVQIYGNDGATNRAVLTDSAGRVKTDATLQVSDADVSNANPVPISDAGSSVTVDNPALSVVGAGAEAAAQRVTLSTETLAALETISIANTVTVVGAAADGSPPSGNPVLVAGQDGTNVQSVRTDTTGNQGVYPKTASSTFGDNLSNTESFRVAENGTLIVDVGFPHVFDGATWDRLRGNSAGGIFAQGPAAHGAPVAGNPLWNGLEAIAHGANPPEADAGDVTTWWANRAGIALMLNGHPNMKRAEYHWSTAQTDDDVLGAISAGTIYVVTGYSVTSDADTTVAVKFRIGFGSSTVPAEPADGASVTGMIAAHSGAMPGGGIAEHPLYLPGGDGQEVRITCEAPTTGSCKLLIDYFTIAS